MRKMFGIFSELGIRDAVVSFPEGWNYEDSTALYSNNLFDGYVYNLERSSGIAKIHCRLGLMEWPDE